MWFGVSNNIIPLCVSNLFRLMYREHDRITREVFGEGYPTADEMERNVSLLMHCASGSVYYPQSLTPNVVKIGATHVEKPKPLPEVSMTKIALSYYIYVCMFVFVSYVLISYFKVSSTYDI